MTDHSASPACDVCSGSGEIHDCLRGQAACPYCAPVVEPHSANPADGKLPERESGLSAPIGGRL
jgi:hypothetical protein